MEYSDRAFKALAEALQAAEVKGLDDQAAADALNATTVAAPRNVTAGEITIWAFQTGVLPKLHAADLSPDAPIELRAVVRSVLALLNGPLETVDMAHPATAAMLDALEAGGLVDKEARAALAALGVQKVSRAETLGLGVVTNADVARARAGKW